MERKIEKIEEMEGMGDVNGKKYNEEDYGKKNELIKNNEDMKINEK